MFEYKIFKIIVDKINFIVFNLSKDISYYSYNNNINEDSKKCLNFVS